jgi:16S rRNA (guanine527-N7)-methyltransferase
MGRSWSDPRPGDLAGDRARALSAASVSRETTERLDRFVDMLLKWQRTTNLIAPSTVDQLWTRHVADSLQLPGLAPEARTWVDLGTGGGFPGLVIACALADRPGSRIHLIDSHGRKAAFLREAVRMLGVPALVHAVRIEEFVNSFSDAVDVVTARAVAPLRALLSYAEPLVKRGALALFPKGQDVETELTDAAKYWIIETELIPSRTSPRGRIVVVRTAKRR